MRWLPIVALALVDGRSRCPRGSAWPARLRSANGTCATFLAGAPQQQGLGHAFMSFNRLVHVAGRLGLTLAARFASRGHGMNATKVDAYFFGAYFDAAGPPAGCERQPAAASEAALAASVDAFRAGACAAAPACAVFRLKTAPPFHKRLNVDGYRAAFEGRAAERAALAPRAAPRGDAFTVAVHIRRGDHLKYGRRNVEFVAQRYVPNVAFLDLLGRVAATLKTGDIAARARVVVLAEGARPGGLVPDIDGDHTDFRAALPGVDVDVGPREAVDAFDALCAADLVVTSKSGFSQVRIVDGVRDPELAGVVHAAVGEDERARAPGSFVRTVDAKGEDRRRAEVHGVEVGAVEGDAAHVGEVREDVFWDVGQVRKRRVEHVRRMRDCRERECANEHASRFGGSLRTRVNESMLKIDWASCRRHGRRSTESMSSAAH